MSVKLGDKKQGAAGKPAAKPAKRKKKAAEK